MSHHTVPAALIAVAGLVIGLPGQAGAADLCLQAHFECVGTEPFWRFETTVDGSGNPVVHFFDSESSAGPDVPVIVYGCVLQSSPNDFELTTEAPISLVASIVGQSCTEADGVDRDFSVTVAFDRPGMRVQGHGCCTRSD